VIGYDSEQMLRSVPGAVHVLSEERLRAFDDERILTSVNSLPGVRFEERSPGSYRLAIRGSTLRSPFGVRNIKVYWNGIPFTDPTGSTALRSEEHTSELQSRENLVCRLLLEKKNLIQIHFKTVIEP